MGDLRQKLIYTAVVYFLFLQLALRYGISGPTLSDLRDNLGVGTDDVSLSVSIMCVGICIGAISSGFLVKFFRRELIVFVTVLSTAIIMAAISYLKQFGIFLAFNLLIGITSGASISLSESWILEIWGNQCGPYMQALQFFRGLGYIIAPILANPFLSNQEESDNESAKNGTKTYNGTAGAYEPPYNHRISTPFILNAVMLAVGAAFLFCLYIFSVIKEKRRAPLPTSISQIQIMSSNSVSSLGDAKIVPESVMVQDKDGHGQSVVVSVRAKYFGYAIVLTSSIFYLFFYEEVIVIFLPTFATNLDVKLTKTEASLLTTAFSLSNVVGKAIGVLLALKLSHFILLYMNLGIMIGSLVGIIIFGNTHPLILWIAVCMHGVGLSSIIASLYTLMESTIEMNALICGILNMCGTLGSVFLPLIVGPHLDQHPMVLMYACLVCACVCLLLYVVMHVALRNKNALIAVKTLTEKDVSLKRT